MTYVILTNDEGDIEVPGERTDEPLASFLADTDDAEDQAFLDGLQEIEHAERDAQGEAAILKFA